MASICFAHLLRRLSILGETLNSRGDDGDEGSGCGSDESFGGDGGSGGKGGGSCGGGEGYGGDGKGGSGCGSGGDNDDGSDGGEAWWRDDGDADNPTRGTKRLGLAEGGIRGQGPGAAKGNAEQLGDGRRASGRPWVPYN